MLPVNFLVDAHTIAYRTDPEGAAAVAGGDQLAFEVDHIDEQLRNGWSVPVAGTADHITDPDTVRALAERPGARPWAGGRREMRIRIVPREVSGRIIRSV